MLSDAPPAPPPYGEAERPLKTTPAPVVAIANPKPVDWPNIVADLGLIGIANEVASHCVLESFNEGVVSLRIDEGHSHLVGDRARDRIRDSLAQYFGKPVRLEIHKGELEAAAPTPAKIESDEEAERLRRAEQAIKDDPTVQALTSKFNARITSGSVQPVDQDQ